MTLMVGGSRSKLLSLFGVMTSTTPLDEGNWRNDYPDEVDSENSWDDSHEEDFLQYRHREAYLGMYRLHTCHLLVPRLSGGRYRGLRTRLLCETCLKDQRHTLSYPKSAYSGTFE